VTGASPRARSRLPRVEREQRILDAAAHEFDQRGFRGASMERIAEGAGITKALVYQYFESKEGVYTACVERGRAQMFDNLERAAAESEPERMLAAVVDSYFDQLDEMRHNSYVLYGDAPRRAVDEMRRRNAEVIEELLRAGSSLSGCDVHLVAQLIVGAGEQVGRWWLEHREVPAALVKARFTTALGWAMTGLSKV
jgi:AcrR family transcriptional regulator